MKPQKGRPMSEQLIYAALLTADLFAGGFLFGWTINRRKDRKERGTNGSR